MEKKPVLAYPIWRGRNFAINRNLCFVIMPFRYDWSDAIFSYIKDITSKSQFDVKRADTVAGHIILEDIWRLINEAMIVIVDITGNNPNVFYELGIAHTLGKNVILLAQSTDDIPFDISPFRHIIYSNDIHAYKTLDDKLPNFIQNILDDYPTGDSLIDDAIAKMKRWKSSGFDYEKLLGIANLCYIKIHSNVDNIPKDVLAFCLSTSIYHGYYEQMPFWLKVNKGNDYAGEALGNYVVMPYKRVRYRAAFCLQYLGDKPKSIANRIIEKDSAREALRLAIENDNVKKFVSENMGKLPDLPKNYGIQLLGEFEAIELALK